MTPPNPMKCPKCGHGHVGSILWRVRKAMYLCKLCGHEWARVQPEPVPDWCDTCNAPQYVTPDGTHHCGEREATNANQPK